MITLFIFPARLKKIAFLREPLARITIRFNSCIIWYGHTKTHRIKITSHQLLLFYYVYISILYRYFMHIVQANPPAHPLFYITTVVLSGILPVQRKFVSTSMLQLFNQGYIVGHWREGVGEHFVLKIFL